MAASWLLWFFREVCRDRAVFDCLGFLQDRDSIFYAVGRP
jgi:hypothetical protein